MTKTFQKEYFSEALQEATLLPFINGTKVVSGFIAFVVFLKINKLEKTRKK